MTYRRPKQTEMEWVQKYKEEAIESMPLLDAILAICQYNHRPMISQTQALRIVELAYNIGFGHGMRRVHQTPKISRYQLERLIKGDSLDHASQNSHDKQSQ